MSISSHAPKGGRQINVEVNAYIHWLSRKMTGTLMSNVNYVYLINNIYDSNVENSTSNLQHKSSVV